MSTTIHATGDSPNITRNEHLAIVRTELANQRTGLAFARTALMLFATGFTFIKVFAGQGTLVGLGIAMIPLSAIAAIGGVWSFFLSRRLIFGPAPAVTSLRHWAKTVMRRIDRTSAAIVFAEAGERETAIEMMRMGREVIAMVGDPSELATIVRQGAKIAQGEDARLVVWVSNAIPVGKAEQVIKDSGIGKTRYSVEEMPVEESRPVRRRFKSRTLRAVLMDPSIERRWPGSLLSRRTRALPVVVVDTGLAS